VRPATPPLPLRGEVWTVRFPAPVGEHPAVVLAANVLRPRLSAVTVVLVTGTRGPESTHVELDADAGMSGHLVSYANATDLHTVPLSRFRRRRGLLSGAELLARLEDAVRLVLDL
jgi:mRNA interferase MazF